MVAEIERATFKIFLCAKFFSVSEPWHLLHSSFRSLTQLAHYYPNVISLKEIFPNQQNLPTWIIFLNTTKINSFIRLLKCAFILLIGFTFFLFIVKLHHLNLIFTSMDTLVILFTATFSAPDNNQCLVHCRCQCACAKSLRSFLTLCDPMDREPNRLLCP